MWTNATFRYPIIYGIAAAICSVLSVILLSNFVSSSVFDGKKEVVNLFCIPVFMFLCDLSIAKHQNNRLAFGKYMSANFLMVLVCCLVAGLLLFVYLNYINPSEVSSYIEITKNTLKTNEKAIIANGISKEEFTQSYTNLDKTTAMALVQDDSIKRFFIAIFCSLLASFYFSKIYLPKAR
jgi:hypothetical protein